MHTWVLQNPYQIRNSSFQYRFKINVCCGILNDQQLGPIAIEGNLMGARYEVFQGMVYQPYWRKSRGRLPTRWHTSPFHPACGGTFKPTLPKLLYGLWWASILAPEVTRFVTLRLLPVGSHEKVWFMRQKLRLRCSYCC